MVQAMAYPMSHVLNKVTDDPLVYSWVALNSGSQSGSAFLQMVNLTTGLVVRVTPAQTVAAGAQVTLRPPVGHASNIVHLNQEVIAGVNNMRLEMWAINEPAAPVAIHDFVINMAAPPPPPVTGPIIDAVGIPSIV